MSVSLSVTPGTPARSTDINNLRFDAIVNTRTAIAGEAFSAYTTDGSGIVFPTLLYQSGTQWFKAKSDGVNLAAGYIEQYGLAYTSSSGPGATFTLILPGSQITSEFFPSMSGGTAGMNLLPSATTAGGVSSFNANTMVAFRVIGAFENANSFNFLAWDNSTFQSLGNTAAHCMYFISGEAISQYDTLIVANNGTNGQVWRVNSSNYWESVVALQPMAIVVAQHAVSGAGQNIRCAIVGSMTPVNKEGGGSFAVGDSVYTSNTPGQLTTNPLQGQNQIYVGRIAQGGSLFLCPGNNNRGGKAILKQVQAGENWAIGDLLYQRKSDGLWMRALSSAPESGICEKVAIAFATHSGGSGSTQIVYMPGSIICNLFVGTAGQRMFPATTPGAMVADVPDSYDGYYRCVGYFDQTGVFVFQPQEMLFLASGVQEKGYCAAGGFGSGGTAGGDSITGVNFKKIMSFVPTSITFIAVNTVGVLGTGPVADNITRFGMALYIRKNATASLYAWEGTYQTAGN